MSLLGIDIGTTGCKAAAYTPEGMCLHQAYREYPALHPFEGAAELDSRTVWKKIKEVIREVAEQTGDNPVAALCVSSLGEAATPVSKDGEILGNSILGSDVRGMEYVENLPLKKEEFYRINPNILAACYTMPKISWIRDNDKELYEKTDRFILWDGLAGFLLGCDPYVTFSGANRTLLFDINKEDWSDKLLEASGIDRNLLPKCVPGGAIAGEVSPEAAAELGLEPGVKVVAGGHDQCCNSLGAGIAAAGKAVDGIGTFECIAPVYDSIPEPETMLDIGLNVEHHVVQGLYISFLYNQAGSLVRWFRDTFASDIADDPDVYDKLTAEMPESPTDLLVLPYFEPTGSPGFISDASGVITGLRTDTKRGEILKAVMECITFYFAESIDSLDSMGIDTSEYIATGGGARSDQWLQIKADILGVPYIRPRSTECGIIGSVILAGTAVGEFSSPEEGIQAMVSYEKTFEPDKTRHEQYRDRFGEYKKLYPRLKNFLAEGK